eukprot:35871_1
MMTTARNSRSEPSARTNRTRRTRLLETQSGTTVNKEYRYGEYFYYTPEYKNHKHFVRSKFQNMEQEVTQNPLYAISTKQWNQTQTAAQLFLNHVKREYTANHLTPQQCFDKFGIHLKARNHSYYNKRYNIRSGQDLHLHHVLALKLFFNDGSLSSAIRKTYWGLDQNEKLHDIKQRHTNFVHICQHILEAIYLYGSPLPKDVYIYRGVTQQTFAWFDAKWSGPVSTSFDFKVARRFTRATGSVVKLENTEMNEMFIYGGGQKQEHDGGYALSDFDEKECLMWAPCLTIVDVPFSRNRRQYDIQLYISAMRLFQKLVSGHLLSSNEKKVLLSDAIQHKLDALIEWKVTGKDDKLMQCVKDDAANRMHPMQSETSGADDDDMMDARSVQRAGFKEEKQDEKEAFESPEVEEKTAARFIKSLCGTVFERLLKTTDLFWVNPEIKIVPHLDENIQNLFDVDRHKSVPRQPCHVLEWKVDADRLEDAPYLTDDYLVIDGYIREQMSGDTNMINALINCDQIMDNIGMFYDLREPLSFECNWTCEIQYGDDQCVLNPVALLMPSSFRANNEFFDMEIQIQSDLNAIPGNEHLMWSVDVVCDELDVCMHFVDQKVLSFRNRRYTQITSNRQIQRCVDANKDIVWKIAFRFHYNKPEVKPIAVAQVKKPINSQLYMKRKINNWLRSKMTQSATCTSSADTPRKKDHMIRGAGGGGGGDRGDDRGSSNKKNKKLTRDNGSGSDPDSNDRRGGSSGGDGDDDKEDDGYDDKEEDEEKEQTNDKELDRFFEMFTNIQQMDDDTLMDQLRTFNNPEKLRDDMAHNVKMLNAGLIRLNKALDQCTKDLIGMDPCIASICLQEKYSKQKHVLMCSTLKQNMCYQHREYIPLKTKAKYKLNRVFTQQTIPQKISRPLDVGNASVYEFMVKMLGINQERYFDQGTIRVFNVGLRSKDSKEKTYLVAKGVKSSRYYPWNMNEILTEREIMSKYRLKCVPMPVQIEGIDASEIKDVEEKIMALKDQIIKHTKWTKIPIYNKEDKMRSVRRMTLTLDKPKFIEYMRRHEGKMSLLPIVMFDKNDKYYVEYVWIVRLEKNVDVGVSFEYNKAEDSVKVVGIYVDKAMILKQHQIVCPSHQHGMLNGVQSEITDLYIGNPDDHRNQMNALKKKVERLNQRLSSK